MGTWAAGGHLVPSDSWDLEPLPSESDRLVGADSPGHENNKRRWTSEAPDLPPAWTLLASSPMDSSRMFFSVKNKTHSTKETNYSEIQD